MLYYLIHQSPLWHDLSNGKRNVRILMIVIVFYVVLSYCARTYSGDDNIMKMLSGSFWWFVAGDIFINAINYRMYYGRSVLREMDDSAEKKEY